MNSRGKHTLKVGKLNVNVTREFVGNFNLEDKLFTIVLSELTAKDSAKLDF